MKRYNPNKTHLIVSIVFLLLLLNYNFPLFRFKNILANYYVGTIFCLLPIFLIVNFFYCQFSSVIKIISGVIFGVLSLFFTVFALFTFIEALSIQDTGHDDSFQNIHEIITNGYSIKVYQTDGGATTDFGIVVRQEKEILPGLLLVKSLYSQYHCDDVRYKLSDEKNLLIDDYENDSMVKIKLNSWVYF